MPHLVVVGASLAGLRACEAARKAGHAGPLTLVGAEPHLPYDRPPLSKQVLAPDGDATVAPYRCEAELAALDVTLRLGAPATALDPAGRRVHVADDVLDYDALVVATGARPRPLPGHDAVPQGVHVLRTRDDALAVRAALDAGARTVVVGAGFVGLEVAGAVRARGAQVTVVEASAQPLARAVGPHAADLLVGLVASHGVDLRVGRTVTSLAQSGGRLTGVGLDDGTSLPAELLVVGVGASPATAWLEGSGLHLDDGVVCDRTLRASHEGVWAAGDVARVDDGTRSRRVEHWTSAHEEGLLAGANAAGWLQGEAPRTLAGVPYVWSDLHGSKLQLLGEAAGADAVEVVGGPERPWLVLYGAGGTLQGVLGLDLPGRVMKFRPMLLQGAPLAEAAALARSRPLPELSR